MVLVLLGVSVTLLLGACDDEDDADATDETGDEADDNEVSGGW
jgi:hypothetical protein